MKVLFVASGNSKNFDIAPFIKSQGESLIENGIDVQFYPVVGKGILGYIKSSKKLKLFLKENSFDLIHAHYTLSGLTAVFSRPKIPIVLSLMGSDAYGEYIGHKKVKFSSRYLTLLTYLIQPFVQAIFSKSPNIDKFVYRKKIAHIVPNGVIFEKFVQIEKKKAKADLGLSPKEKYVLFLGDPKSNRKNYSLARRSVDLINNPNIKLLTPYPTTHDNVIKHFNAADVFVMCAFMEGSPNVVKEAMVCNCPVVTTDVGDAAWVVGDTPGCYVASFTPQDFANKIQQAVSFSDKVGRTEGRKRIIELGLSATTVANRISNLYTEVIDKHK